MMPLRRARLWLTALMMILAAQMLQAQVFVQIEARPSLTQAEQRLREYAGRLEDLAGFQMGTGWYAIALGPYERPDAEALLRQLRGQGVIPSDSFIARARDYRQQFWPIGAQALTAPPRTAPLPGQPEPVVLPAPDEGAAPEPMAQPALPDETPAEARRSERALSPAEREELQRALEWAGTYSGAIDGLYGRGTRSAMAAWQEENGYEATGVLTTGQRAALLQAYNAVLDGMDLAPVTRADAGIEITLPTGAVTFEAVEYPFVRYTGSAVPEARVLLISQPGNRDTLHGLYELMQTLQIVPPEGARSRNNSSFTLTGANGSITSHTEARLVDGTVKGFTLVWPAGDEDRRGRILRAMQAGFAPQEGALQPPTTFSEDQRIDLAAGLQIRQPQLTRSGFYVNDEGAVITTAEAVRNCARITLDKGIPASVAATDGGLALLTPTEPLRPLAAAILQLSVPQLRSAIAVAGYSYGGVLGAPTLTFGTLQDLRGLDGESGTRRLDLPALPGDAGGPVMDEGGTVLGMLLPREDGARQLPQAARFAASAASITALLDSAGVPYSSATTIAGMTPEDMTWLANGMTVLVSCWDS